MLLDIQELTQSYKGGKLAIDQLSLAAGAGILGLLGPNGAGKTSLMRILATISKPTSGKVLWRGRDIVETPTQLRDELGYLPQYFGVYDQLSGREFLHYLAGMKGLKHAQADGKISELLERLNLLPVADASLTQYSGGMRQRIGIAQALLNDPALLIVDEPTVGLDPQERAGFRQLLSEGREERLVILSTHIVSDVESIADTIAIMAAGKLIQLGSPQALQAKVADKCWQCHVTPAELTKLQRDFVVSHSTRQGDSLLVNLVADVCPHPGAQHRAPSLEDAYLYFVANKPGQAPLTKVA